MITETYARSIIKLAKANRTYCMKKTGREPLLPPPGKLIERAHSEALDPTVRGSAQRLADLANNLTDVKTLTGKLSNLPPKMWDAFETSWCENPTHQVPLTKALGDTRLRSAVLQELEDFRKTA